MTVEAQDLKGLQRFFTVQEWTYLSEHPEFRRVTERINGANPGDEDVYTMLGLGIRLLRQSYASELSKSRSWIQPGRRAPAEPGPSI